MVFSGTYKLNKRYFGNSKLRNDRDKLEPTPLEPAYRGGVTGITEIGENWVAFMEPLNQLLGNLIPISKTFNAS